MVLTSPVIVHSFTKPFIPNLIIMKNNFLNKAVAATLLLFSIFFFSCTQKKLSAVIPSSVFQLNSALVSVAIVDKSTDGTFVKVRFFQRQQPFVLSSATTGYTDIVKQLERSAETGTMLKAELDIKKGNLLRITEPTGKELEEFRKFSSPEKITNAKLEDIDVHLLDPSFNDITDKIGKFARPSCGNLKIVPSYHKLVKIFNLCKKQACVGGGPYTVSPCIPFQYVPDGCYARAHKMRYIIEELCGYCSHKVFSFALGQDDLAVRANFVGGCCVQWWYHVAPLVPVRSKHGRIRCYVIDPSMFNKPVLLTEWLSAQENTSCTANANVTKYSIQPSSAFWPSAYGATATFDTDPNYILTNQYLLSYQSGVTCN
jgi:hypothetical protein